MFELYKLVDGEWWIHGKYEDAPTLAIAANILGKEGFDVKVVVK